MKTSFIIRLVVAAILSTLACVGFAAKVPGVVLLFSIYSLLLIPRGELTRPIPRSERSWTLLLIGVILSVLLTLPFLHLPPLAEPHGIIRVVFAVPMWLLSMCCIYRKWQREKGQADA